MPHGVQIHNRTQPDPPRLEKWQHFGQCWLGTRTPASRSEDRCFGTSKLVYSMMKKSVPSTNNKSATSKRRTLLSIGIDSGNNSDFRDLDPDYSSQDAVLTKGVGTLLWSAPEVLVAPSILGTPGLLSWQVMKGLQYGLSPLMSTASALYSTPPTPSHSAISRLFPLYTSSYILHAPHVLWEIWLRMLPFEHLKTTWAICDAVEAGERPVVPANLPPSYGPLMEACWNPLADERPRFPAVVDALVSVINTLAIAADTLTP